MRILWLTWKSKHSRKASSSTGPNYITNIIVHRAIRDCHQKRLERQFYHLYLLFIYRGKDKEEWRSKVFGKVTDGRAALKLHNTQVRFLNKYHFIIPQKDAGMVPVDDLDKIIPSTTRVALRKRSVWSGCRSCGLNASFRGAGRHICRLKEVEDTRRMRKLLEPMSRLLALIKMAGGVECCSSSA